MLNARVEFLEKTFDNVKLKAAPRRWDLFRLVTDDCGDIGGLWFGEVHEVEWTPGRDTDLTVRVRPKDA